ncbi:hypothetical protein EPI10_017057 [Gossypium australe]|uniref:Chromo domain-containing protein n=1 Tax=Gossypium australe TaxID=47621 RepID=A0A5B6VQE4_9ROSI|nr:hypothetical protein EPI10_017057 [Gossypium australe]
MDFIMGLPSSKDKTVIMVVVDRLSKYSHFTALLDNFSSKAVATDFLNDIVIGTVAYKLDLPAIVKVHHVSLIHKCIGIPEQQVTPIHLVDSIATLILQPSAILDTRNVQRSGQTTVQYLIQWDGFPYEADTWEDKTHMLCIFPDWNLKGKVLSKPGRKYALELIAEAGLEGAKPVSTPMEQNRRLTIQEYDQCLHIEGGDELLEDVIAYKRLIGKLLYLTSTRQDIAYSEQYLSQLMQQPKKSHCEAALRIVKYVKKNPGQGFYCLQKAFYIWRLIVIQIGLHVI